LGPLPEERRSWVLFQRRGKVGFSPKGEKDNFTVRVARTDRSNFE
jgi:hypothetical protein